VGAKRIENRSWSTSYRGLTAIHAGGFRKAVDALVQQDSGGNIDPAFFSYGALIGVADLIDVVKMNRNMANIPWAEGPYCLCLENARLFDNPILHKGRVGLSRLPDEVAEEVRNRIACCRDVKTDEAVARCIAAIPRVPIDRKFLRRSERP
jgi:hypothetical protein